MSTELSNYLAEMNKVYDEALSSIKKQKEENPSDYFLTLLLDNNEKIKRYITHFSIGSGLTDIEDNRTALAELLKKHTEFTNFVILL
jgi:hypothetical protein